MITILKDIFSAENKVITSFRVWAILAIMLILLGFQFGRCHYAHAVDYEGPKLTIELEHEYSFSFKEVENILLTYLKENYTLPSDKYDWYISELSEKIYFLFKTIGHVREQNCKDEK